jgi:ubiquinone/menaquinone biosynthesis C-methylase UbiE
MKSIRPIHKIGMALSMIKSLPEFFDSAVSRFAVALADPQPGEHLLDIGAGLGPSSLVAAHRGAKVTSLEPSAVMRAGLNLRNRTANLPLEIISSPVESISLHDDSVDVAIAVNSLHHWENHMQGYAEVARVLRSGGRLYLLEEMFDHPSHSKHEAMNALMDSHNDLEVDPAAAKDELAEAGFRDIDIREESVEGDPVRIMSARLG